MNISKSLLALLVVSMLCLPLGCANSNTNVIPPSAKEMSESEYRTRMKSLIKFLNLKYTISYENDVMVLTAKSNIMEDDVKRVFNQDVEYLENDMLSCNIKNANISLILKDRDDSVIFKTDM